MQLIPMEDVRVNHRGQQIVRRGNGVKITVVMKIYSLCWFHARESAAGSASFLPEHRTQRGFARGDDGAFAQLLQTLSEPDGSDGLAFTRFGGAGRGDQNQLAPLLERRV